MNAPNMNNYFYLLGASFILKLIAEMLLGSSIFISIGIVAFFLIGFLGIFISGKFEKKKPDISIPPTIQTEPVREDTVFVELDRMMQDHHLELRLRRVDDVWQITFIRHEDGIIRIVGMGSAVSILDALIKAEADLLEKSE